MVAFTAERGWSFPFDYGLSVSMGCTVAMYDCVSWKGSRLQLFEEVSVGADKRETRSAFNGTTPRILKQRRRLKRHGHRQIRCAPDCHIRSFPLPSAVPKREMIGVERSRACRGTKRRGRRGTGGNTRRRQFRRERKSRSLVAADPSSDGQYLYVQESRPTRRDYLRSRGKAYGAKIKDKVVRLYVELGVVTSLSRRDAVRFRGREASLRKRYETARKQWLWIYCSQSGEPPELATGLLNVILTVSTDGWGALPSPSYSGPNVDRQVRPAPPAILEPYPQEKRGARFVQQCPNCRVCYETRNKEARCPKCHPRTREERLETAARAEDARRRRLNRRLDPFGQRGVAPDLTERGSRSHRTVR